MGFKKGRTFSIKLICAAGVVLITGLAAGASLVNLPVSFVSHLFIVKEEAELANSVNPSENKSQVTSNSSPIPIEVLPQHPWVDSVLNTLTLEEKIGQLFMVSAYSNRKESEYREMENLIRRYNVGGILFFQGGPERQAALTNRYQAVAKVPMLIGLDAEWGLGMRLDSTISYPRQLTLGGISDNQLIYEMGYEIGRQLRRIGVNVNFAPVADINSNPRNPVIGNRSFGDDKVNVSEKASAYMKGLQDQQVIAVAKHFPGHGDTNTDSHHTLPVLNHTREKLTQNELFPFKKLIRDSLTAVMSGHLHVKAFNPEDPVPASLSPQIIEDLLRKDLGFRGLVFTDAMNMKGVTKSGKPSEVNLRAVLAGNDIILAPMDVAESIQTIKTAVENGEIDESYIDQKVQRILRAKYLVGLNQYQPVELKGVKNDINSSQAQGLKRELLEAAVAVIKNENGLLPLPAKHRIASISVGANQSTPFAAMLNRFGEVQHFVLRKPTAVQDVKAILKGAESIGTIVMSVHKITSNPQEAYGVPSEALQLLDSLRQLGKRTVVCLFGTPYSLNVIPEADAIIVGYEADQYAQEVAAQIVFGSVNSMGQLAINAGGFTRGTRVKVESLDKLGYSSPDLVGMNGDILANIDYIAEEGIAKKAYPGCQVLIAHRGRIVFEKSYGTMSYDSDAKVTPETLFDLASVTKVTATLQVVMQLYDEKKIDLNQKASFYLPELKGTDKQNITLKQLLIHQAGLKSFYPFLWESTMLSPTELSGKYYSNKRDSLYSLRVSPTLFANHSVQDSVWKWIIESPMGRKNRSNAYPYVYSDLGFIFLQKIIERVTGTPLDEYVNRKLIKPLGLERMTFNPLDHAFNVSEIAPTENDNRYRGELLRGTVHDQMAALIGGVAGHAGAFGNARDLAVILQMNLWKGTYGGKRYIQPETVELFAKNHGVHRGLGWNKPRSSNNSSYLSALASPSSYGHTGFTGNIVWVDPEKELIFIFLSNRVHPSSDNNRINTLKIRRRIHDVAYEAILRYDPI